MAINPFIIATIDIARGAEMAIIGTLAAVLGYAIGRLLGGGVL